MKDILSKVKGKKEQREEMRKPTVSYRIILYNNGLNFDTSFPNELEVHNLNNYAAKYRLPLSHKNV